MSRQKPCDVMRKSIDNSKVMKLAEAELSESMVAKMKQEVSNSTCRWSDEVRTSMGRYIGMMLGDPSGKPPNFFTCAQYLDLIDQDRLYRGRKMSIIDAISMLGEARALFPADRDFVWLYLQQEFNFETRILGIDFEAQHAWYKDERNTITSLCLYYLNRSVKDCEAAKQRVIDFICKDRWTEQDKASVMLEAGRRYSGRLVHEQWERKLEVIAGISSFGQCMTEHLARRSEFRSLLVDCLYTHTRLPKDLVDLIAQYAY